jgi:DNA-binding NarL/FixJ family response regulator
MEAKPVSLATLEPGRAPSWEHPSSDGGPYEIVLAEDDPSTLAVVRHALESDGFRVVAEARDAAEAVAAVLRHRPDVCLLEVDLPGDGIMASQVIWSKLPDARIAMLASSMSEDDVVRAINAGADGYLLKSTAQGRLTSALRAVARGETALPRTLTTRFVDQMRQASCAEAQQREHESITGTLLYLPRFTRHFYRRRRMRMSTSVAWSSARERMHTYR